MPPASGRELARRALRRIDAQQAFAAAALDEELERAAAPPRERALATEICYGVLRHRSRIDRALAAMTPRGIGKTAPAVLTALRVAAYQLLWLDRVPAHAAVDDAVSAARRAGGARLAGFANGVLRRLVREGEPPLPSAAAEPARYAELACSMPPWLVAELEAAVGRAELCAAAEGLTRPAPLWLRVNRLRATPDEVARRLAADHPEARVAPSPRYAHALAVTGLGAPERSPSFREGLWTVQDLGAQLVGALLEPPGDAVLDACAGLGGKATHLAELCADRGLVEAADASGRKLSQLAEHARRLGLTSIQSRVADLVREPGTAPRDGVVLDAPCTGLGVLRRHPEAKWRVVPEDVARLAALQRQLLDALAPRVRPGGALVYSVCTFTRAEGPDQVAAFLERHRAFSLEAPAGQAAPWSELCDAPGQLRTWPHRHEADAFFAARLVRRG